MNSNPANDPPSGSLNRYRTLDAIDQLLAAHISMVAILARREVTRIRELTREANQLERDITQRVTELVPSLLEIPGCGALSAGKLVGEAANITQIRIHPNAQAFIKRRLEHGSTKREALRLLKRKLANVVYRTLLADTQQPALATAA